jgi:hypothetical protein
MSIMMHCPNTMHAIYTGIDTDRDTFKRLPEIWASARCPVCATDHHWNKRSAWLDEVSWRAEVRLPVRSKAA